MTEESSRAPEIIDGHTHLASSRYIPLPFFEGVAENTVEELLAAGFSVPKSRVVDQYLSAYSDHDGSGLIKHMDDSNVSQCVVLLPDFTFVLKSEYTIEQMFLEHRDILRRYPGRLDVFAGVDPRWGREALELFVRGVEDYGFRGLKLYPPCGYRLDDPLLEPLYEYCHEHRLPVLSHIGPTSPALGFAEAQPIFVDAVARRFDRIPFILAHGAANEPERCTALCRYRPNVYLDLSGAQHDATSEHRVSSLKRLFSSGIGHKVIFGTDWPINNNATANRKLLSLIARSDHPVDTMTAAQGELILAGNIKRILGGIELGGRALAETAEGVHTMASRGNGELHGDVGH